AAAFARLLEAEKLLPLSEWCHFQLVHGLPSSAEAQAHSLAQIKAAVGKAGGLYLYARANDEVLYIGKAKSLYGRLKSHFLESFQPVGGDTKHQTWHRFFSAYPERLDVYWYAVEA